MANSEYITSNRVKCALARASVKSPGAVATLLLDTFIKNSGRLRAAEVYSKKLCEQGKFYAWRKELCDKNWLIFELTNVGKVSRYYPGKKLVKYINQEKEASFEIATTKDLNKLELETQEKILSLPTRKEFETLKEKVDRAEKAIMNLIENRDPPATKVKVDGFFDGTYQLPN